MGAAFIYESAKDVLRWNNLSVKEHINLVMRIGNYLNMSDKDFEDVKNKNEFLDITLEDLNRMYHGND